VTIVSVISDVLLAAGALFLISGGVGLLRFPDFYTRIHAASLTDSAGAGLILIGLLLRVEGWEVAVRLLIILFFLALTGPTAAHALAHAARRDGVPVRPDGERKP
jgi:multicomponent Na+:H+ antiporter subunit G